MSYDKMNPAFTLDPLPVASIAAVSSTAQPVKLTSLPVAMTRPSRAKPAFTLQWAAGFADGEGCICIVKQRYADPKRKLTYRLVFCIVQNDLQVLEHFYKGLGIAGGIFAVKRIAQHNRQIYTLNYSGLNALKVITALQPYLIRKRIEAQTAHDYWEQGQCGRHPGPLGWSTTVMANRERNCKKMKSLK